MRCRRSIRTLSTTASCKRTKISGTAYSKRQTITVEKTRTKLCVADAGNVERTSRNAKVSVNVTLDGSDHIRLKTFCRADHLWQPSLVVTRYRPLRSLSIGVR